MVSIRHGIRATWLTPGPRGVTVSKRAVTWLEKCEMVIEVANCRSWQGPAKFSRKASFGRVHTTIALLPSGVQPLSRPNMRKLRTGSPAWAS